jgi:Cys-rich repeat protein
VHEQRELLGAHPALRRRHGPLRRLPVECRLSRRAALVLARRPSVPRRPGKVCAPDGTCVVCQSNGDCPSGAPVCHANQCVQCFHPKDCPNGQSCTKRHLRLKGGGRSLD